MPAVTRRNPAAAFVAAITAAGIAMGSAAPAAGSDASVFAPGRQSAPPDTVAVLAAALEDIREEFPFGRVVFDRVVIDTTKRLAPPLLSGLEHAIPERWTKPNRVEPVHSDYARPVCRSGNVDCALPGDITAAIAFSLPELFGDSARVIARSSRTTGVSVQRVTTVVEVLTLRRVDGSWTVTHRKIKATT